MFLLLGLLVCVGAHNEDDLTQKALQVARGSAFRFPNTCMHPPLLVKVDGKVLRRIPGNSLPTAHPMPVAHYTKDHSWMTQALRSKEASSVRSMSVVCKGGGEVTLEKTREEVKGKVEQYPLSHKWCGRNIAIPTNSEKEEVVGRVSRGCVSVVEEPREDIMNSVNWRHQLCDIYWRGDHDECESFVADHAVFRERDDSTRVLGRLEVKDVGSGGGSSGLIAYIHGWPDTTGVFINQMYGLREEGYDQTSVALPMFNPDLPDDDFPSLTALADRIADTIRAAQRNSQQKVFLVGHDWGAGLGYMVAQRHPGLVERYAALDIGNDVNMWERPSTFITIYQKTLIAAYNMRNTPMLSAVARGVATTIASSSPTYFATPRMGVLYAMLWDRPALVRSITDGKGGKVEGWVTPSVRLPVPLLFLWGTSGEGFPGDHAVREDKTKFFTKEWAERVPYRTEEIDGGHWFQLQAVEDTNARLLRWFREELDPERVSTTTNVEESRQSVFG